jgi:hypothetical protein
MTPTGLNPALRKAADRDLVFDFRVGHDAVEPVVVDQVRAHNAHGLDPESATVHRRMEKKVQLRMPKHRVVLGIPFDEADDLPLEGDRVVHGVAV